jgi:hypothetical protein
MLVGFLLLKINKRLPLVYPKAKPPENGANSICDHIIDVAKPAGYKRKLDKLH